MNIVTLTTDMGLKDHYVAVVKGALYSQVPDVRIVDVSHHITPFDNAQTAFVLGVDLESTPADQRLGLARTRAEIGLAVEGPTPTTLHAAKRMLQILDTFTPVELSQPAPDHGTFAGVAAIAAEFPGPPVVRLAWKAESIRRERSFQLWIEQAMRHP